MSARKDVQPVYDQNDLSIREKLCSGALVPYLNLLTDIEHLSGIENGGVESVRKEFISQVYAAFEMTSKNVFGKACAVPFVNSLNKVAHRYKQDMSHHVKEEQIVKKLIVQHFLEEMVEEVPFYAVKNGASQNCINVVDDICITLPDKKSSRYRALLKDNLDALAIMGSRDNGDVPEWKEDLLEHVTRLATRAYEGELLG